MRKSSASVGLFLVGVLVMSVWFVLAPPLGQPDAREQNGAGATPSLSTNGDKGESIVVNNGSAKPALIRTVARPRSKNGYHRGVAILVYGNDPMAEEKAAKLLNRLAGLGVNSVDIVVPIFQSRYNATRVYRDPDQTPSAKTLRRIIRQAKKRRFSVSLKPLLDEHTLFPDGYWRGNIEPSNVADWFDSYSSLILEYARFAESEKVDVLDVGVELESLSDEDAHWRALVKQVRRVYAGQLTYSINWGTVARGDSPSFLGAMDFIGLDPYFPLDAPQGASVRQIRDSWKKWAGPIRAFMDAYPGKRLVLTELGSRSAKDSYLEPSAWWGKNRGPVDLKGQARYYRASCQAARDMNVRGIYWWFVTLDAPNRSVRNRTFIPLGKPSEREIAECFRRKIV